MKAQIEQANPPFQTPIDGTVGNAIGEFQRIEDKYLVASMFKEKVLDQLYRNMEPSYLDKDTHYTLIESLYFDSPKLEFFQHHFLPLETRYKMRIRRYAPNGIWANSPSLLELKQKKEGTSRKTRFMVSATDLEKLKKGKTIPLSEEIQKINPNLSLKTLTKRIDKVNELISQYSLRPVLSVQYHRLAFEKDGFRVTVDQQLTGEESCPLDNQFLATIPKIPEVWAKAMTFQDKFSNNDKFVMEIKHQGFIPSWMVGLLQDLHLEKTGFSKYCWFIVCKISKSTVSVRN